MSDQDALRERIADVLVMTRLSDFAGTDMRVINGAAQAVIDGLGLTQTSRVDYEIVADVDGERAYQHGDSDPYGLRRVLADHPERYRPGSRVERITTRWWTTPGETTWEEVPQ